MDKEYVLIEPQGLMGKTIAHVVWSPETGKVTIGTTDGCKCKVIRDAAAYACFEGT